MATAETVTLNIEGMMCPHCEARVREALSALPGVEVLRVSHEENLAEIRSASPLDHALLAQTVQGAGYTLKD